MAGCPNDINPVWNCHDFFNSYEAAMLTECCDPLSIDFMDEDFNAFEQYLGDLRSDTEKRVDVLKNAIERAIENEKLKATIHYVDGTHEPDWDKTVVAFQDLRKWLSGQGYVQGFFFSEEKEKKDAHGYLDPRNPHYAPKLALLVNAWIFVDSHQEYLQHVTVKQRITKWMNDNAANFNLTDDEGEPLKVISELASIANWDVGGGAPKTPSRKTSP